MKTPRKSPAGQPRKTAIKAAAKRMAAATKAKRGAPARATNAMKVGVVRLPHAEGLPLPAYQTPDSAGLDLVAALPARKPLVLKPRARALVPTGLTLELPRGTEAQVRPRSGLALKAGVTVLNSPGTIDADYRGEVQVLLINHGSAAFRIARGDRIAQLVVAPVAQARLIEITAAGATTRGAGGFGATGVAPARTRAKSKPMPRRGGARKAGSTRRVGS